MASSVQLQRERKAVLRAAKRAERTMDTKLEIYERELKRLLKRKTLLDARDGSRIIEMFTAIEIAFRDAQKAAADFVDIVSG